MSTSTTTPPATKNPPYYAGVSQCDGVYGGEEHWAVLADECRGVVADVEGGLTPEAEARAEFIVRACNAHEALIEALDDLLTQTVDWNLKLGIELTEGEYQAREKVLTALAAANGR